MNEHLDTPPVSEAPLVNGHAKEPGPLAKEYILSAAERAGLQILNSQSIAAKMTVYNLNTQLEPALAEVKAAEARWLGALGLLATAHGMEDARLAPDFSKLTKV